MSSASLTCDGQVIVLRRLQSSQRPLDQHGGTSSPSFYVFLCFDWIIVGRVMLYIICYRDPRPELDLDVGVGSWWSWS